MDLGLLLGPAETMQPPAQAFVLRLQLAFPIRNHLSVAASTQLRCCWMVRGAPQAAIQLEMLYSKCFG